MKIWKIFRFLTDMGVPAYFSGKLARMQDIDELRFPSLEGWTSSSPGPTGGIGNIILPVSR
jgi:hypothetical protein